MSLQLVFFEVGNNISLQMADFTSDRMNISLQTKFFVPAKVFLLGYKVFCFRTIHFRKRISASVRPKNFASYSGFSFKSHIYYHTYYIIIDILFLHETWIKNKVDVSTYELARYNLFFKKRLLVLTQKINNYIHTRYNVKTLNIGHDSKIKIV